MIQNILKLGLIQGLLFSFNELKKSRGYFKIYERRVKKNLKLRRNSSDINVFKSVFFERAYELYPINKILPNYNPKFVVDCGANTGFSALYFSQKYPAAKILAIEAAKDNFELLNWNVGKNKKIEVLYRAFWPVHTFLQLANPKDPEYSYQFVETLEVRKKKSKVESITPQALIQLCEGKIDILKIDIEGAEKEIFEADTHWLEFIDILIIELHDGLKPGTSKAFWSKIIEYDFCSISRGENQILVKESLLTEFRKA